ncbi:MAG TPA: orotidine 5'-phosphate decarboxylase / HUMPS family protein [Candidatus Bathyarchaeia archaeon]|nr:orotidine 5'-phosphate decarboxylase / HUMPS family protein [Candidatus Bathyarchaeia archaeon]
MSKNSHPRTPFQETILKASKANFSRIVLALNLEGATKASLLRQGKTLIEKTGPYICGIRFGRQTVLNLGTDRTRTLVAEAHDNDLSCIIDDKLNDIDDTNRAISQAYFGLGFDGIIVNPFVGWKGGLDSVFKLAAESGKGVIVLVYMSHPGAVEGYGRLVVNGPRRQRPFYEIFAEQARKWHADGAVVGATRPDVVAKVRKTIGEKVDIYSPGIGAQGGRIHQSSRAGSDFFIVGRSITQDRDPEKAAQNYARDSLAATS